MKPSPVLVRLSSAALLGAGVLALSASSRAEIIERVVAKVNGDIVTQSEFEARQLAAVQAARIAPDQVESYLRQNNARILQEAVDDLLITQRAADLGIKLRPEYVQDVIEGIKKENNIPDDAELKRQLRREGMSLDDLKRNIERSVLRRQVLSRELEQKTMVTEAEARAEYEKHKSEYGKSASVHLQEIVVPTSAAGGGCRAPGAGGRGFRGPGPGPLDRGQPCRRGRPRPGGARGHEPGAGPARGRAPRRRRLRSHHAPRTASASCASSPRKRRR